MRQIYILILLILTACISCDKPTTTMSLTDQTPSEDKQLLDKIQRQTINYMWEAAEPTSGAARERLHMDDVYPVHGKNIVTSGGTGFGIMALIVGIERGFIPREEGIARLEHLTGWLESTDKFHGAWSHWMHPSGEVYPFSQYDDGGDLVETAFLAQGLVTARQYLRQTGNKNDKDLAERMDALWKDIDWQWYTQGKDVLYWHWSPKHGFKMDFAVRGHNECLIMYVMAACSPTHGIDAAVFHDGYMRSGAIKSDGSYYGLPTVVNHYANNSMHVGPLFWSHYSHLGLDPRNLTSEYGDFWKVNQNHALIHHRHCKENPYQYRGYSDECWGLTSSYSMSGYAGHNPQEDLGVISPTAALSSFPYTPTESMKMLRYLDQNADLLWGEYGPYDAFSHESQWYIQKYLAIDQLPIPVMIENYRTGLLWDLFMSAPEIQNGLDKLGFSYNKH